MQKLASFDPNDLEAADAAILGQLRTLGADLSLPREVLHYIYLPTENAAEQVAAALAGDGFSVEHHPAADVDQAPQNPWLVLAITETVVTQESVRAARHRMQQLASEHGGNYDGWEAAAKP